MTKKGLPWWTSILSAVGVYCSLKYGIPLLHPANPTLQKLFAAAPTFAPLLTIPWLLLAAKQLYDTELPEEKEITAESDEEPPEK